MVEGEVPHFKVVLLGDPETGKTSLANRWVTDAFPTTQKQTVGSNHLRKRLILDAYGPTDIHVWDTAGQDYQSFMPIYAKGASFVIIVVSITNKNSFDSIQRWVKNVNENSKKHPPMALAVNKIDKTDSAVLTESEIHSEYDSLFEIIFFVSALSGKDVDNLFSYAAIESFKFAGANFERQQPELSKSEQKKHKCFIS
ncbi:small GTP-binding protein [Histomonas meleagridis]|uniref:small GTP-binding protein n=1 Tax=Histomonas meleagridis TaxID=135588 RepID=UPI003559EBC0|nr:small GTP-binding protein [Histomonas meleagridis]KAH0799580.1 small GTP-binding protein [Histomonas meleagridis]